MKLLRHFFNPAPCPHIGHIAMTTTYHHGRTICDACGTVFAEWLR